MVLVLQIYKKKNLIRTPKLAHTFLIPYTDARGVTTVSNAELKAADQAAVLHAESENRLRGSPICDYG